jgi:hypothetical protein
MSPFSLNYCNLFVELAKRTWNILKMEVSFQISLISEKMSWNVSKPVPENSQRWSHINYKTLQNDRTILDY